MGDSGERVGDTCCWACCRRASELRDSGLTPAGRCCGEEPGVFIPGREGGYDSGLQRATHTPTATAGDSSISQSEASEHALIAKPRMHPLPRPQYLDIGAPSSVWAVLLPSSHADQHSRPDPARSLGGACPVGPANQAARPCLWTTT